MKTKWQKRNFWLFCAVYYLYNLVCLPAYALPPEADTPEEVLRTEIITEARSPIDGKPLTPSEYAQLQAQLQTSVLPPEVSPKLRELIFLLRVRRLLRTVVPILP